MFKTRLKSCFINLYKIFSSLRSFRKLIEIGNFIFPLEYLKCEWNKYNLSELNLSKKFIKKFILSKIRNRFIHLFWNFCLFIYQKFHRLYNFFKFNNYYYKLNFIIFTIEISIFYFFTDDPEVNFLIQFLVYRYEWKWKKKNFF